MSPVNTSKFRAMRMTEKKPNSLARGAVQASILNRFKQIFNKIYNRAKIKNEGSSDKTSLPDHVRFTSGDYRPYVKMVDLVDSTQFKIAVGLDPDGIVIEKASTRKEPNQDVPSDRKIHDEEKN